MIKLKIAKMKLKIVSENPKETQKIAFYFGNFLNNFKKSQKGALVVSLEGELGSGKTEFLKGVAKAFKIKEKIWSPTFILMRCFKLSKKYQFKNFWHLDLYRLKRTKDLKNLGFFDLVKDRNNLIFIEWGNKMKKLLPKKHLKIKFKIKAEKERFLEFFIPSI